MSTTSPTNIIIIGASAAGANLARSLEKSLPATHRIVLIEARDLAFWPPAALRAAVVPGALRLRSFLSEGLFS